MGGDVAVWPAFDEAHLRPTVRQSQTADVQAQTVAELHGARRFVDVAADEETGVSLCTLANGFAADVATIDLLVQRGPRRRAVGEDDVAGVELPPTNLVLFPLVAEAEVVRPRTPDPGDLQIAYGRAAVIDVPVAAKVREIVVSRDPSHGKSERVQPAKQVVDRCVVARVPGWGTLSPLAQVVAAQVADQQDAVNTSDQYAFEDRIEVLEACVNVPDDRQPRHGCHDNDSRSRKMLWLLIASVAIAGKPKPWDGMSSDIVVEREVGVGVEVLVPKLTDLQFAAAIFPEECMYDWSHGSTTSGLGAIARVTYHMGSMKRRLTAKVTRVEDHVVEYDHEGNKGFITQWRMSPAAEGTTLSLGTYIHAPPWPFRPLYFNKIHPKWTACYEQAMDNLAAEIR